MFKSMFIMVVVNMSNKIVIEPELLWSLYWGNRYDTYAISSILDCSQSTIAYKMKQYGVPRRRFYGLDRSDFCFSERQKQIFEGCMLGDGGLRLDCGKGVKGIFRNADIHKEYLVWLQKYLGIKDISKIDYGDSIYILRTRATFLFRDEYVRWYPDGAGTNKDRHYKIPPADVSLGLVTVLFWYLGDGTYVKRDDVAMFTSYFDLEVYRVFSKQLMRLFDVVSGVTIIKHCKDSNGIQRYCLRFNKVVTNKFFDMVDSLDFDVPECYQYKFGG